MGILSAFGNRYFSSERRGQKEHLPRNKDLWCPLRYIASQGLVYWFRNDYYSTDNGNGSVYLLCHYKKMGMAGLLIEGYISGNHPASGNPDRAGCLGSTNFNH